MPKPNCEVDVETESSHFESIDGKANDDNLLDTPTKPNGSDGVDDVIGMSNAPVKTNEDIYQSEDNVKVEMESIPNVWNKASPVKSEKKIFNEDAVEEMFSLLFLSDKFVLEMSEALGVKVEFDKKQHVILLADASIDVAKLSLLKNLGVFSSFLVVNKGDKIVCVAGITDEKYEVKGNKIVYTTESFDLFRMGRLNLSKKVMQLGSCFIMSLHTGPGGSPDAVESRDILAHFKQREECRGRRQSALFERPTSKRERNTVAVAKITKHSVFWLTSYSNKNKH